MASPGRVLLLSCYELGHQPLGLATPLAFLSRAGLEARGIDLAVDRLDEQAVRAADFVGVSVPMHTALRVAIPLVRRLRELTHQPIDQLLNARYEKFRRMGVFLEGDISATAAAAPATSANGNGQVGAASRAAPGSATVR